MWSLVSFLALVLCFMLDDFSEASRLRNQHPSAVVVGTVYCDTCFHQDFSKSSHFISGALVAVECGGDGSKPSFREEVKTNEKGEFRVKLPFSVSKHVNKIKTCAVKLISSNEPYCAVASTATSSSIHLKSKKPGTNIFSAGFFTFKPLKQPELCNQKPRIKNSKELDSMESTFPPTLPDPPSPFLPPIGEGILPSLPLPDLPGAPSLVPPLPRIPGIPIPPVIPETETAPESDETTPESGDVSNEKTFGLPFPPNPFRPPSLLPPLPLQPPPASILPPNPFLPSPPSLIPPLIPSNPPPSLLPPLPFPPVVPIPSLIPSPPPPPPSFPIPLPPFPPFPFQPSPGFPGVPPASSSSKKTSP